jgi:acyl-CoA synthetase (AMP-forming)/AMP-acid ligase II
MGVRVTWVSRDGLVLRDLVPTALRRRWVAAGHCPDRDVYSLFADRVREQPYRIAVIDDFGSLNYRDLDAAVRRAAAGLAGAGLGSRDVIAIQQPNGRDAVIAELAVAALGAVALPCPVGRDVRGLLARSRARAVLTDLPSLPPAPGWRPAPVDPEAPARILVSSGSEAEPKMVAYSHNAMVGGRGNYVRAVHAGAEPRDLVLVSLASAFGSFGTPVTLARFGGTLLLSSVFDPAHALRMITSHRPAHVFGVPTMLRRMAALPGGEVGSLRAVVASGADLPPATAALCRDRFGCPVVNVYGSSDGVNCHTRGDAGVGRPDPAVCDLRVVDDEIQARGPMTPLCYVGAPELDERYRLPDGWVRTGDRGHLDADGTLHVTGRLRRIAIRGGCNISLAEVEQHVHAHPSVADTACLATPDADLGERVCAFVVPRAGAVLTAPELLAFLARAGLDRHKHPEHVRFLPELPLGPTGKVCRRTLASLLQGDPDPVT